jgi:hypothetical protein
MIIRCTRTLNGTTVGWVAAGNRSKTHYLVFIAGTYTVVLHQVERVQILKL